MGRGCFSYRTSAYGNITRSLNNAEASLMELLMQKKRYFTLLDQKGGKSAPYPFGKEGERIIMIDT